MAERAISQVRRSQFLNNIAPVNHTFDELIRRKLECGKFPITKTGFIKIFSIIMLITSVSLFMGQPVCNETPNWYPYVHPVVMGSSILLQLVLYTIFSTGYIIRQPGKWVKMDILLNLVMAFIVIVCSVLTTIICTEGTALQDYPGPIGIVGGILEILGCVGLFLMYRYVEDEFRPRNVLQNKSDPRKSLQV